MKHKYPKGMDEECIPLCDAINSINGLQTVESCCGHGSTAFRIWFVAEHIKDLPILLYYIDPCHVGFRWHCEVKTDCAKSPVVFCLYSETKGDEAYEQANEIARKIEVYLISNEYESDLQKPLIYIASPYTGKEEAGTLYQIALADELRELGFLPYWPLSSHYWHQQHPHDYDFWMQMDYEWIDRCDALLRMGTHSKGAAMEVEYARSIGLPVFFSMDDLRKHYDR